MGNGKRRIANGGLIAATACMCLASSAFAGTTRTWVPFSQSYKTDAKGFRWDINNYGSVYRGQNNCFANGMLLQVNGNNFQSNASTGQMSPDGTWIRLNWNYSSLAVTRWINVDLKAGCARYLDVFHNPTASPIGVTINYNSNLRSNPHAIITDKGVSNPPSLGKKESGLVFLRAQGNASRPSVLYYLGGPNSKLKPNLNLSGRSTIQFSYPITVPAGKRVSLLHALAQRNLHQGVPDKKKLAGLFKPLRSTRWLKNIPRAERKTILDFARGFL